MNDKPKGTTLSKQNLAITNMEVDVLYSQGKKQLDRLQAVNLSLPEDSPLAGKPLRMTIFNAELKTYVRGKTDIIADIEERLREDSEYGPDRTIVQVYDEKGQPVSRKQPGGGGGNYRRSLEDDLELEGVKRLSIEGQTAIAQVGTVLTCPTPVPGEDLGIDEASWKRILAKYWRAVEKGLDNYLAAPPPSQAAKPTQAAASKPDQKPPGGQQAAPKSDKVKDQPTAADPVKHVGDLLTRANKIHMTPTDVSILCEVNRPDEITDLDKAWEKILKHAASKKEGGNTSEEAWDNIKRTP